MRVFTTFLAFFFAYAQAFAAPTTVQSRNRQVQGDELPGVHALKNFSTNPFFETNTIGASASAGSLARTSTTPIEGNYSLLWSSYASGSILTLTIDPMDAEMASMNCEVSLRIKTPSTTDTVTVKVRDVTTSSDLVAATTFGTDKGGTTTNIDVSGLYFPCSTVADTKNIQVVPGQADSGTHMWIDQVSVHAVEIGMPSTLSGRYTLGYDTANTDSKIKWVPTANNSGTSANKDYLNGQGDFEHGLANTVRYANTAQATPVTGAGGSPTHITVATTTSSPLADTTSLLVTNAGSTSAQGEGVSIPFTIDSSAQGHMLKVNFDYLVASGTYAGDMSVFVYDVTNGVLISPSANSVPNAIGNASAQPMEFPASSTSTSYRLIFHVATTNTAAWSMKVDSLTIARSANPLGPVVVGDATWVPTGSWSTNTTYSGVYSRVANKLFGKVHIVLAGAPTAAGLTINLPAGLTIDTSALGGGAVNANVMGGSWGSIHSSNNYGGNIQIYSTTSIALTVFQTVSGTNPVNVQQQSNVSNTNPITWGSGDTIDVNLENIPIVGWGTSSGYASPDDSRPVRVRAHVGSGSTATTFNSTTTAGTLRLNYDVVDEDTHGAVTTGNGGVWQFTSPKNTCYSIMANASVNPSGNTGKIHYLSIGNATTVSAGVTTYNTDGNTQILAASDSNFCMTTGQVVYVYPVTNDTSNNLLVVSSGAKISISELPRNYQFAASDPIYMTYYCPSISLTSSGTLKCTVKSQDPTNGYNTSTGKFTVPQGGGGAFQISSSLFSASATADWQYSVLINGVTAIARSAPAAVYQSGTTIANNQSYGMILPVVYHLNGGDTVELNLSSGLATGATYTNNADSYFSIVKVGP